MKVKFADRKGGFPHSEICGSKGARASPHLIAACHVLHRLSTPRHPLEALSRLIVLSKTHAWVSALDRTKEPMRHTCALYYLPDNDVFYQSSPCQALTRPGQPFIHDVKPAWPEPDGNFVPHIHLIARMVEPDGIEPTTSCLQSTRSTN